MITLYECAHARVFGIVIYCRKSRPVDLHIRELMRGDRLCLAVCQECADFERMGPPVPAAERGWV